MEPLSFKTKQEIYNWLTNEKAGKAFLDEIKGAVQAHTLTAQLAANKYEQPNQQIAAQVNRAAGLQEIIDFVDSIALEIKEKRKERQAKEEL